MSDLFSWATQQVEQTNAVDAAESVEPDEAPPRALTVSELNKQIKSLLEGVYPQVLVEGEISNFKPHSSGHFYFSLKDSGGQISAVMFRGANSRLKYMPQDGMKVLVRGSVTVYPQRGNYQILVQTMEPMGEGALRLAFEQMKARLEAEGLFSPAHKIPLPTIPRRIAIVTSPTGAAIRDMLHVINRRYPRVHICIFPVRVQGETAAGEIAAAIATADKLAEFDVIIAGRGGGSLEDLWPFNEEIVARAIFACRTPIISAVGHEIDYTIADFVADYRAPTPSAAAEIAVPNEVDLLRRIGQQQAEILTLLRRQLQQMRHALQHLESALVDPRRAIQDGFLRLADLSSQLTDCMTNHMRSFGERADVTEELVHLIQTKLQSSRERIARNAQVLESLSPLSVLARGYSIVTQKTSGRVVTRQSEVKKGDRLNIRLSEGDVDATAD